MAAAAGARPAATLGGPPESTYFSTARIDPGATVGAPAVGDGREPGNLWPNSWSGDDNLYTAYSNGEGFSTGWFDIGVARMAMSVSSDRVSPRDLTAL